VGHQTDPVRMGLYGSNAGPLTLPMQPLILRESCTDHSVVGRVTGRYQSISSFKGCAAGKSSGFHIPSHALQFVTHPVRASLDTN
jgi:hypothetical protein